MSCAHQLYRTMSKERFVSEAWLIRTLRLPYRTVRAGLLTLLALGSIEVATMKHGRLKPMRIYRRRR